MTVQASPSANAFEGPNQYDNGGSKPLFTIKPWS
jgi:hypothetical protein